MEVSNSAVWLHEWVRKLGKICGTMRDSYSRMVGRCCMGARANRAKVGSGMLWVVVPRFKGDVENDMVVPATLLDFFYYYQLG